MFYLDYCLIHVEEMVVLCPIPYVKSMRLFNVWQAVDRDKGKKGKKSGKKKKGKKKSGKKKGKKGKKEKDLTPDR